MAILPTGGHRLTSLQPCMGTHLRSPKAAQTTQQAPMLTLEGTHPPSPPFCLTLPPVPWSLLPLWPTSWPPLGFPTPSFSPPTVSPTQQASCIKWLWASTPDCFHPPLCIPRGNSNPSFPRTPTSPHLLTAVSLSALPK